MMVQNLPSAELSLLDRPEGSATYSQNGYSIVCAVNGPIEVQRRDELPEEAAVDVVLRPAVGVGGTRERHLESILHSTLRHIILVQNHPRTLIQITLQVTSTPENDSASTKDAQSSSAMKRQAHNKLQVLPMLPSLLQASLLALLSASIPLSMTLTSTLIAIASSGNVLQDPTPQQLQQASSTHVLAFSSHGDLLVAESDGSFNMDTWEQVYDLAERVCRGQVDEDEDEDSDEDQDVRMETDERNRGLEGFVRGVMQEKVVKDQRWKEGLR
ncbi:MAG: exosome non-catalytic core subunit rrp46 [Pycnora praestabilis]|nr:MAG: exosome non-catalytic core subunit rrp46 [Pycnora praestabilis]